MEFLASMYFFIFGTIIGSFLNVVILRYNTGMTLGGRSKCFSCSKRIFWYDLLPVVSFLVLGGKCRACKSRLSFQYPIVELLTGFLFLATFLKYQEAGFSFLMIVDMAIMSLLVVIGTYDFEHKIIPDALAFLFGGLALFGLFFSAPLYSLFDFSKNLDLLAGPILAVPIFVLWIISKGMWIGLGDAKLALGIGWFLGFFLGISAMIVGFWIGAIFGVLLILFSKFSRLPRGKKILLKIGMKNFTMKSEVPLAPFLIAGCLLVYFSRIDVMNWQLLF